MKKSRFQALIFDMDGTLTEPTIDFGSIRRELGFEPGDLAAQILALPEDDRRRAWQVIERHEEHAMRAQKLQSGAAELLGECRRAGLRLGLLTRNARKSVDHLCGRYRLVFDIVITREFSFIKPHPAPLLRMIETWSLAPDQVLMIGDYRFDIDCGRAAGTRTCFFQNPGQTWYGQDADYTVHSMAELSGIVFPKV